MFTNENIEVLHDFANKLGLKREWFQQGSSIYHYDLTESKRIEAIKLGAIEINTRDMLKKYKTYKNFIDIFKL